MSVSRSVSVPIPSAYSPCQFCPVHDYCISCTLAGTLLRKFEAIRAPIMIKRRNEYLFQYGSKLDVLYVVRSGALKTIVTTPEGDEQITGFCFPGDTVGLDGIETGHCVSTAIVLQTSSICTLSLSRLGILCSESPQLQGQVWRLMSREVTARQEFQLTMAQRDAEARLAMFLLSLSERMQRMGYSATHFQLPMTRHEIGNYLGLSMETVSRVFTQMQNHGLISKSKKFIQLTDISRLQERCINVPRYIKTATVH